MTVTQPLAYIYSQRNNRMKTSQIRQQIPTSSHYYLQVSQCGILDPKLPLFLSVLYWSHYSHSNNAPCCRKALI